MRAYIIRRILIAIPLLLAITFVSFLFIHMAPGTYFDTMMLNPQVSPELIQQYKQMYHLDKPVVTQYLYWLKNLLHFNLGYSFHYHVPVTKIIVSRLFNTLLLSVCSLLVTWMLAIPLGVWAAVHHNKFLQISLHFPLPGNNPVPL